MKVLNSNPALTSSIAASVSFDGALPKSCRDTSSTSPIPPKVRIDARNYLPDGRLHGGEGVAKMGYTNNLQDMQSTPQV